MKRSMTLVLGILLLSLTASPALSQGSGDMTCEQTQAMTQTQLQLQLQLQQQLKNHENTEPNLDGNGGINRNMTVGEQGPHGDDYTHHVDSETLERVLQAILDQWNFVLPRL